MDLFFIIFIIFIIYVLIQIYYYSEKYIKHNNNNLDIESKNTNLISKIESFEATLKNINKSNQYYLEDASLEILLDDYDKLKETDIY
jgi:hypothetical protein